ncbi:sugar-binding protein, partial [Streptomyces sp. NPDC093109]
MDFTAAEEWMYFVLIGERPLQASSDMAYENMAPHDRLSERLQGARSGIMELSTMVDGALPPDSADQFKQTTSRLLEIVDQLSEQASGQGGHLVKQSNNIMTSKIELQIELAFLLAELATITAMSFFTGGLSFFDTAIAKARTTVSILTILTRLMGGAPGPFSSILQALTEALTNFAAQVMTISLTRGDRRPSGIDWKDVGISAFAGFVGGIVGDVISKGLTNYFKNNFKNFYDNKWGNFGANAFTGAASEGPSEGVAEILTNGIFYGSWKVDPMSIAGGSISAVTEVILSTSLENIANKMGNKFFDADSFTDLNVLPDPNSPLGGGGGSNNTTSTPDPITTVTPNPNTTSSPAPTPTSSPAPTPTSSPAPTPTSSPASSTADLTPLPLPDPVPNGSAFVTPPPTPAPTPAPLPDATPTPLPASSTADLTPLPLPDPVPNGSAFVTPPPTPA